MPGVNQTESFLNRVSLFQGLKKRQLEQLARKFVTREYSAGQAIVTQGREGEGLFVIEYGKAEAVRERADGDRVVLNILGPTDFFGEIALLDDGVRTASVVATETTRCLVLTRWDFLSLLMEDVDMAITVLQELAKRLRMALDFL